MSARTYPYIAWTLQPSFKPVQVEIVQMVSFWMSEFDDCSRNGKCHHLKDLFPTKADAIAAGRERLAAQQAKLDKMQIRLDKRRAALDKAEQQA